MGTAHRKPTTAICFQTYTDTNYYSLMTETTVHKELVQSHYMWSLNPQNFDSRPDTLPIRPLCPTSLNKLKIKYNQYFCPQYQIIICRYYQSGSFLDKLKQQSSNKHRTIWPQETNSNHE